MEMKRKFLGVWIPAQIWEDPSMSLVEKALLVEINSLDNENGCTAGNSYFAKFFLVGERQIRNYIARLKELGLVKVTPIGRTKRRIEVTAKYLSVTEENCRHDGKKLPSGDGKKFPHSNTEENKLTISSLPAGAGKQVNELIDLFKGVNGSHERLFARKPQREAMERMMKKFGFEKCAATISALPDIIGRKYAPTITTPVELENKLGSLLAFVKKEGADPKTKITVAF